MNQMTENLLFLQALLTYLDRLQTLVGDDWPAFRDALHHRLVELAEVEEEEQISLIVDKILELGLASPAAELVRSLFRQAGDQAGRLKRTTRSVPMHDTTSDEVRQVEVAYAVEPGLAKGTTPVTRADVLAAAEKLAWAVEPPLEQISLSVEERPVRYLNAGFFSGPEARPVPLDRPLALEGGPYRLGVNVGRFWGPGQPDQPFPEALVEPFFTGPELELDVVVRSFGIEIPQPHHKLLLPRAGDSPVVLFDLTPAQTGRQALDVDLLLQGHLLQSRRVELFVTAQPEDPVPKSAWPVQDGYTTFTRTAGLNPADLEPLWNQPRGLTIVAERDLDYNRIGLRFYDLTGSDLGLQQSILTDANLTPVLTAVRTQLATTMQAYTGSLGSTEAVLTRHLGQLAAIGRKFYLALLPGLAGREDLVDEGQQLKMDLAPGMVIQVAPLSSQLGIPWELLYERKIEAYREERISLCPTFLEHGPEPAACPGRADPTVVCPHGFWGYRYIIEQLPRRVEPHHPLPAYSLPWQIRNNLPLRFTAPVFTGFSQLEPHLTALRRLAPADRLDLRRVDSLDGVRLALTDVDRPADILYFYAHGGQDPFGSAYLKIGADAQIQLLDLDAWEVNLTDHQPLVILNACESADYNPDSFENLLKFFCDAGAAGVIGTQCEVKEKLANAVMLHFFQRFLRQAPAGEALFEARQTLLRDHLDPRGLAYSLFAAAEVQLAQPVIE